MYLARYVKKALPLPLSFSLIPEYPYFSGYRSTVSRFDPGSAIKLTSATARVRYVILACARVSIARLRARRP